MGTRFQGLNYIHVKKQQHKYIIFEYSCWINLYLFFTRPCLCTWCTLLLIKFWEFKRTGATEIELIDAIWMKCHQILDVFTALHSSRNFEFRRVFENPKYFPYRKSSEFYVNLKTLKGLLCLITTYLFVSIYSFTTLHSSTLTVAKCKIFGQIDWLRRSNLMMNTSCI